MSPWEQKGPSVACLIMEYIEELFFAQYEHYSPILYKLYIDDIYGASCSEKELQCFIDHVTNFNPSVKYTYTISNNTVTFYDIQFKIDNNHIKSCVHFKHTTYTIIFYSHPVIHLHANNPFHFHKCYESNNVVLAMMMSLRS